jgi:AcrR family transcriptional regulator
MPKLYPGYRDEIREKIVREAYPIFMEKGYNGTKMDDIASNLGVTKPAIYRYFRTKDELFFVSVVEHVLKELVEAVEISFTSNSLSEAGDVFFDVLLEGKRKYATLERDFMSIVSKNEALCESIVDYNLVIQKTLENILKKETELENINPRLDVKDLAHIFTTLVDGLVEEVIIGMDPVEIKSFWHRVFAELLQIQRNSSD